jgi:hypothetical protein
MKQKLKLVQYQTFNDVQLDARLMFENCKRYNAAGTPHHAEANRLLELCERTFQKHRAAWALESGTVAPELAGEVSTKTAVASAASEGERVRAALEVAARPRREVITASVEVLPPRRFVLPPLT